MINETIRQYATCVTIKISRDLPILAVRLNPTRTIIPTDDHERANGGDAYFTCHFLSALMLLALNRGVSPLPSDLYENYHFCSLQSRT